MGLRTWPSQANFVLAEAGGDGRAWPEGLISRARMNPLAAQVSHIVRKRYSIHGSPDVWVTAPWSDGDCPTMTGLNAGMM
jgi:hypothetical protein